MTRYTPLYPEPIVIHSGYRPDYWCVLMILLNRRAQFWGVICLWTEGKGSTQACGRPEIGNVSTMPRRIE
jgi:hypothetical protein